MRIDDLTVDAFVYDFPVWVIADRALMPCQVYVFNHEKLGPTLPLYTNEDAALLAIERAPLAGHVPLRIDDPNELRALADTLRGKEPSMSDSTSPRPAAPSGASYGSKTSSPLSGNRAAPRGRPAGRDFRTPDADRSGSLLTSPGPPVTARWTGVTA